ncbi:putative necrosis-inducing factor-domain-containing protein [Cladorrhinum sp. PSN332]|nr:putative necrosis-inducing factor-domain-containing protein [Cladorrhinum sp. PSN332]
MLQPTRCIILVALFFIGCGAITIFVLSSTQVDNSFTSVPAFTVMPQPPTDFHSLKFHDTTNHTAVFPPPNNVHARRDAASHKNQYCWTSYNITDETSDASPLVSDCQNLMSNIAGGGDWSFISATQRTLAKKDSCAFGVETENIYAGVWVRIGNEDIVQAMQGLIQAGLKKGAEEKVGGKGWTVCPEKTNTLGPVGVRWGVYHT